ncbi:DUF736 domain-containing protein [uncultured Sphingorhabdus sp.]|uniref:DUF736 domain-containing protein n=1 Tax=uncultured Sphingorhabdus sp. TaxID=1686106 RepID=UPI002623B57F|nr:DUF736 domain-containing protein [uncultured Sphingorhabdus sp.]HMS20056.1 DUF736 domain-containing protein [Sphingorhabdus sp.]
MMKIGYFLTADGGYSGHITTLTLDIGVSLMAIEPSANENAPDYRVISDEGDEGEEAREIGAGWKRTGEKAGDYVAIQIDDPMFVTPLRANLFKEDGNAHVLIWSRPVRQDKAD